MYDSPLNIIEFGKKIIYDMINMTKLYFRDSNSLESCLSRCHIREGFNIIADNKVFILDNKLTKEDYKNYAMYDKIIIVPKTIC